MNKKIRELAGMADEQIAGMFQDYVTATENEERHSEAACKDVDAFEKYCEKIFPGDIKSQNEAYEKMMDVAVEFEEGGFVAGFKWAVSMMKEQESFEKEETQITT